MPISVIKALSLRDPKYNSNTLIYHLTSLSKYSVIPFIARLKFMFHVLLLTYIVLGTFYLHAQILCVSEGFLS